MPATTSSFHVQGMSCAHCVGAVTAELSALEGVTDVDIDLASGQVNVTSDLPLDPASVSAAVEEAGYEVSS